MKASKSPTEFDDFRKVLEEFHPDSPQNRLARMYDPDLESPLDTIKYLLDLEFKEAERMCLRYFHVLETKMEVPSDEPTAFKKLQIVNARKLDRTDFDVSPRTDDYKRSDPDMMFHLGFGYFQRHPHFQDFVKFYNANKSSI